MSDLLKSIENWYKETLLSERFPDRAIGRHSAEERFLQEKKLQIMVVTRALGSVAVFKLIPNPPKSETQKVVAFINEAIEMDPDLFRRHDDYVLDAIAFHRKYQ